MLTPSLYLTDATLQMTHVLKLRAQNIRETSLNYFIFYFWNNFKNLSILQWYKRND